jgi:uncharacterized protein YkwD
MLDGLQIRAAPMAEIGTRPQAGIATLDNAENVERMPNLVFRQGICSLSDQVFQDINAYRYAKNAQTLQRPAGLDQLAKEHCEYLRKNRGTFDHYGKNVSHDRTEGRVFATQLFGTISYSQLTTRNCFGQF